MVQEKKNTRFAFSKPISSDWAFWIFIVFFVINFFASYSNYYATTTISALNGAGLFAAVIDLIALPAIGAAIFPTSLVLLVRHVIRKRNNEGNPIVSDTSDKKLAFEKQTSTIQIKVPKKLSQNFIIAIVLIGLFFVSGPIYQNLNFSTFLTSNDSATSVLKFGTLKQKPELIVVPSPTPSVTKKIEPAPTKSSDPKVSKSPEPAPTNSWWPAYFTPWGNTIAYKYNHYASNGCTDPNDKTGCWGGHSIEFQVTEPCTTLEAEFEDESGEIMIGYHTTYVSTGRTFYVSAGDSTPLSPGRLKSITCHP
jgi:hypothetical protein